MTLSGEVKLMDWGGKLIDIDKYYNIIYIFKHFSLHRVFDVEVGCKPDILP